MNTDEAIQKVLTIPEWMPDVVDYAVVGGCPRDMILGKDIKDVDIAVQLPHTTFNSIRNFEATMVKSKKFRKVGLGYGSKFKVLESKDKSYNVMYMSGVTPLEYVERQFDFGICMALLDMEGGLWVNDAFLHDVRCGHLTLYPFGRSLTTYQIGCAIDRHWRKLAEKFNGWELKISEETTPSWFKIRKLRGWV